VRGLWYAFGMLKRVTHVNLSVVDVEAARRFYSELLGLEEIERVEGRQRPGAWFRLGALELHLSHEPEPRNADSKRHVAFEVRDLVALRDRFEEAGVRVEEGSPLPGLQRFFARDPSGNRLEFQEPVERSPRCG
jgi:catechol 2,3-dioxygenase-like lactoylglutathione lyase family enzyme